MTDKNYVRYSLIDQLRLLIDEINVLRQMASSLHEEQITNTERGPSVKQCYGKIIMRDRNELLPKLKKIGGYKNSKPTDPVDWNSIPMEEIFFHMEKARRSVIKAVGKLNEKQWEQEVKQGMDVYGLLLEAVHDDVELFRDITQQLYRVI